MNRSPKSFVSEIKDLPGFRSAMITDIESNLPYVISSVMENYVSELACAYNSQIIKAKLRAVRLNKSSQKITRITTTLSKETHIMRVDKDNKYFLDLIFDNKDFNAGLVNLALNNFDTIGELDPAVLEVDKETATGKTTANSLFKNFFFSEFGDPGTT